MIIIFASQNSENTRYIVEGFFSVLKFTALLWRAKSEVVRPNHIYTLLELKGGTIRLMPLASYKQRLRKDRTNKHIWKSTFRFALYICIASLSKKVAGKKTMIIDPWTKQEKRLPAFLQHSFSWFWRVPAVFSIYHVVKIHTGSFTIMLNRRWFVIIDDL
jgi:hypothetical protein